MSNDTPHSPCPYEDCASSDAFNWNDDGYGFCHSCHQSYPTKNMPAIFGWAKEEYPLKDNGVGKTTCLAQSLMLVQVSVSI